MKKTILIICACLFFNFQFFHSSFAQVSMPVPFGSFEQWTTHQGYSVNAMVVNLPVYDSYTTPTGWNYLSYPVNETVSMGFFNININTNIPLIVASQETGNVPNGNSAAKLETFMIDDIIDPTVLSMASSYIDSSLANTVIPSILVTGEVNIENFIPIMMDMMPNVGGMSMNTDSLMSLLSSFMTVDVNTLITGGIEMGTFEPSRLTGSYKYHSADSGDNGGVVMIGTHYNTTLGKRDVVGGGANIALTDCTDYDTFAVDYVSLHTLDASYADVAPDSLIILVISSASMDRQQGSYLCVDDLILWMDTTPTVIVPDTCPEVLGLHVTPGIHNAEVSWYTDEPVDNFLLEYGEAGFEQGTGTTVVVDGNVYVIESLEASTSYDVYVRSICNPTSIALWRMEHFVTNHDTCARIISIAIDSSTVTIDGNGQVAGYRASWQSSFDPVQWEVEYGLAGFASGSGISDIVDAPVCSMAPLQPNTQYELRVRTICNSDVYGEWETVLFYSANPTHDGIELSTMDGQLSVAPNPAQGQCVVSLGDIHDAELRLYSVNGSLIKSFRCESTSAIIELPYSGIFLLQVTTLEGTMCRKIVNR